jgi:hypothetical protein
MSDTPLTDEAEKLAKEAGCIDRWVSADACRKMERMYNTAVKTAGDNNDSKWLLHDKVKELEEKLAEKQETIDRLNEHCNRLQGYADAANQLDKTRLSVGDPVVVTAPNEFEGKTGEIYDFSPSGTFVIVNLYNHGKHSMHLSDITYNEYADQEQDEEDDWYDEEELDESENPKLDAIIKNIQARVPQAAIKRPEIIQRIAQMVKQADPAVTDAMATAQQLVQQYGQGAPAPAQTNVNDIKAQARSGNVMAQLPKTSAGTPTYAQQHSTFEGFQDFNKVEPYAVCLAGKPVKKFDYYEEARRFHDNWKKKLYNQGDKAKADTITLMPLNLDEMDKSQKGAAGWNIDDYPLGVKGTTVKPTTRKKVVKSLTKDLEKAFAKEKGVKEDTGSWIVYDPETQQIKKRFKTHTAGKSYAKTHGLGFASSEYYFDNIKNQVNELSTENLAQYKKAAGADATAADKRGDIKRGNKRFRGIVKATIKQGENDVKKHKEVDEGQTDYQKRRQRERDIDAGKPVAKQRQPRMTDYQKKRAQDKKDMELGEGLMKEPTNRKEYLDQRDKLFRMLSVESDLASKQIIKQAIKSLDARYGSAKDPVKEESSTSNEAVEIAIIKRILVAHTDLIMQFGLDKVTQAIEEVAYNVGDVDEIGTSDVSAYVNQVRQILGVK